MGLIEVGSFGHFRLFRFLSDSFVTQQVPSNTVLVGTSRDGRLLLISRGSGRDPNAGDNRDEIEVTTLDGKVVSRFQAMVRGISPIDAELSPDGRKIVFSGMCDCPARYGLHMLDDEGSIRDLVQLSEAHLPRGIGWSTDGQSIVYDSEGHIYIYNLMSGASTPLIDGTSPNWSPDGRGIAYRKLDRSGGIIDPSTRAEKILEGVKLARGFRWSPNSRYLLFTNEKTGDIRVVRLSDQKATTVLRPIDGSDESRLRWIVHAARRKQ